MLSRYEIMNLKDEEVVIEHKKRYWPRWLRNSFAQIIDSVIQLGILGSGPDGDMLVKLKTDLLKPITAGGNIKPRDKELIYGIYIWFVSRNHELTQLATVVTSTPNEDIKTFTIECGEDLFETMSGKLIPIVVNEIERVYEKLGILVRYSALRERDTPIKLYASTDDVLRGLRTEISGEVQPFCDFQVSNIGKICLDAMSITGQGGGSSSLYFIKEGRCFSITAGHNYPYGTVAGGSIVAINQSYNYGVDIAVVRTDTPFVNPVPYSYILSFNEYIKLFESSEGVKVYKIGAKTGLTVGTLLTVILKDVRITDKEDVRVTDPDGKLIKYCGMVPIIWESLNIPFAVPGDSGSTIFGIHKGRFYPLGIHCLGACDGGYSYAVELKACLGVLAASVRLNINDDTGNFLYNNPPDASCIRLSPVQRPLISFASQSLEATELFAKLCGAASVAAPAANC